MYDSWVNFDLIVPIRVLLLLLLPSCLVEELIRRKDSAHFFLDLLPHRVLLLADRVDLMIHSMTAVITTNMLTVSGYLDAI